MLRSIFGKILLGGAVAQATSSLRQEFTAIKIEITNKVKSLLVGIGILAFALGLTLFAVGLLALAGVSALSNIWPTWLAALVMAGVLLLIASIFLGLGLKKIRKNSDLRPDRLVNAYRRFTL